MTLSDARKLAIAISGDTNCVQHVNALIVPCEGGNAYKVDPSGYLVSDWCDCSTVETYSNGEQSS